MTAHPRTLILTDRPDGAAFVGAHQGAPVRQGLSPPVPGQLCVRLSFGLSLAAAAGQSVVYVKEQLGHGSIQITVDTYGYLIPGANRAASIASMTMYRRPDATQAQPEPFDDDVAASELANLFGRSGEPRGIEPAATRCAPAVRLLLSSRQVFSGLAAGRPRVSGSTKPRARVEPMPLSVPPVRAPAPLLVPLLPQVVPVPGGPALGEEVPVLEVPSALVPAGL
jgi:hypothetical protein